MFRVLLKVLGGLLIAFGMMWALQGAGLLNWPAESVMLAERKWVLFGILTSLTGAALIWGAIWLGRLCD